MNFFFRRNSQVLEKEVLGLHFRNPVGAFQPSLKRSARTRHQLQKTGFVLLDPPGEHLLEWSTQLKVYRSLTHLAVNLRKQIVRHFSLVYDFADLIIIDPDSDSGIDATDISDTHNLLEEIVSLRFCYDGYTPVLLRLTHGLTREEMKALLSACQLYGLDGVIVPDKNSLREARELTLGRLPLVGVAESPEDAQELLAQGAVLVEARMRPSLIGKTIKILEKQTVKLLND